MTASRLGQQLPSADEPVRSEGPTLQLPLLRPLCKHVANLALNTALPYIVATFRAESVRGDFTLPTAAPDDRLWQRKLLPGMGRPPDPGDQGRGRTRAGSWAPLPGEPRPGPLTGLCATLTAQRCPPQSKGHPQQGPPLSQGHAGRLTRGKHCSRSPGTVADRWVAAKENTGLMPPRGPSTQWG